MNTNNLFTSKEQYLAFRSAWKQSCTQRNQTTLQFVLYALMRGKSIDTVFTPTTNPVKLANGRFPDGAKRTAIQTLRWLPVLRATKRWHAFREEWLAPFGGEAVEPQFWEAIQKVLDNG